MTEFISVASVASPGNHRSTGLLCRCKLRSITTNCGHVGAAGSERLDHREPQPLAAAGDDHVFSIEVLHVHSPLSLHQAWWL
jgi:hypothetical protein